jgi:hypothetical protein
MATADFVFLAVLFFCALSLVAYAADGAKPRIELPFSPSQRESAGGPATVDDARLKGELAAATASARSTVAPDFRRRFQVVRAETPPAIDGRLDDAVWSKAIVLKGFTAAQWFNDSNLPAPAADETEAMVLFDDSGLYVGVRAFQDPATIYTTIKENGWLRPDLDWETGSEEWANSGCDEIEIAVDPELTMASYYVFHVNPDGVRQKRYMPPVPTEGGSYKRVDPVLVADDRWKVATTRDEKGWYLEVFIPYESIAMKSATGAKPGEVYFDRVTGRTVMGLNINRISHVRREPSSWSPSRGVMFFRDVQNFGNAYFKPFPAFLADVKCEAVSRAEGKLDVTVTSRRAAPLTVTLKTILTSDGAANEKDQSLTLQPSETKSVALTFAPAPSGSQKIEVRLIGPDGEIMDRSRYAFQIPPSVAAVVTKTVLYEGEADFPVAVTVTVPADRIRYRLLSNGKEVASLDGGVPAVGEMTLPFEVAALAAGDYEFVAELSRAGTVEGSARQSFAVVPDPSSLQISGKAGAGGGASGVPAGFTVLASTVPGGRTPRSVEAVVPYATDEMKKKGYLWYAETATADSRADGGRREESAAAAYPRRAELSLPMRAFAAGDEYEAVAFAFYALDDLVSPRVEFSDLESASGGVIRADQMDLRAERSDLFLVKLESLGDIPKNTLRRYFLTIYVAPGTPAGIYTGTLSFSAEGRSREDRPYSLIVLPFKLEPSPLVNGIYGGMQGSKDTPQDMAVAADLLAHGMDNPTCFGVLKRANMANVHQIIWDLPKDEEEYWLGDGPARFDVGIDEQVFRNLKDSKLRGPFVVDVNYILRYLPCTEENAEGFLSVVRRIEDMRKKYGLDEFTYHLVDEPNNHYTYDDGRYGRRYGIERIAWFGRALHTLGLRCYETMNSAGRGYDIAESARDEIDIWCGNFISDTRQIERWTTGGKELWLYNYAGDGWSKGAMRSTYGLYALRVGAKGVTIWHHPAYVGWNDQEKKCVGKSSWEAGREGIDDVRYVTTLQRAIDTAAAAGGAKAALAAGARKDLDSIINAYPPTTSDKVRFERLHDASDWDKWRWIIASWILKLQA